MPGRYDGIDLHGPTSLALLLHHIAQRRAACQPEHGHDQRASDRVCCLMGLSFTRNDSTEIGPERGLYYHRWRKKMHQGVFAGLQYTV